MGAIYQIHTQETFLTLNLTCSILEVLEISTFSMTPLPQIIITSKKTPPSMDKPNHQILLQEQPGLLVYNHKVAYYNF